MDSLHPSAATVRRTVKGTAAMQGVIFGLSTTRPATHTKERGGKSGNDEMGVTGWCTK